jgi:hypothetical protein
VVLALGVLVCPGRINRPVTLSPLGLVMVGAVQGPVLGARYGFHRVQRILPSDDGFVPLFLLRVGKARLFPQAQEKPNGIGEVGRAGYDEQGDDGNVGDVHKSVVAPPETRDPECRESENDWNPGQDNIEVDSVARRELGVKARSPPCE